MKTSPTERRQDAEIVELRIAARAENVALARLALSGVAAAAGAPPGVVADLKLAVSEACTNAVQHAYAGEAARTTGRSSFASSSRRPAAASSRSRTTARASSS